MEKVCIRTSQQVVDFSLPAGYLTRSQLPFPTRAFYLMLRWYSSVDFHANLVSHHDGRALGIQESRGNLLEVITLISTQFKRIILIYFVVKDHAKIPSKLSLGFTPFQKASIPREEAKGLSAFPLGDGFTAHRTGWEQKLNGAQLRSLTKKIVRASG